MIVLFQVVIPVFAIILCGFLAGRLSLLSVQGTSSLNYFVYYFALPALLFYSVSTAPVEQVLNPTFLLANLSIIFTCFLLTVLIFKLIFKKKFPDISMYGMITTYGNTGFLGIPLLVAAFGPEAAVPAAILTFVYDLVIITLVVGTFETAKVLNKQHREQTSLLVLPGTLAKSVLLNPINASLILGVIVAVTQFPLPEPVYVFTDTLGPAAGPTALFALGLGLSGQRTGLKNKNYHLSELTTLLGLKLVALPLIAALFVYVVFPLEDDLWAISVVILSALPTGAIVYVFAEKYQTLIKQVPLYILATTVISIFTISVFLMVML